MSAEWPKIPWFVVIDMDTATPVAHNPLGRAQYSAHPRKWTACGWEWWRTPGGLVGMMAPGVVRVPFKHAATFCRPCKSCFPEAHR